MPEAKPEDGGEAGLGVQMNLGVKLSLGVLNVCPFSLNT